MNLDDALDRFLLPHWRHTTLLQAALFDATAARRAWDRWIDSREVLPGLAYDEIVARPMLPLLYDSVRRNQLTVGKDTATYLRSAYLRESLRSQSYFAIVDQLSATLTRAGVAHQLIKGAAIAREFYREPALRHAHDVEFEVADARAARKAIGFDVHPSGLPVRLHEAQIVPPTPSSHLARVLTHAAESMSRENCRWIADAFMIVSNASIDWNAIPNTIATRRMLKFLRSSFLLDIPELPVLPPSAAEVEQTVRGLYAGRFRWWRQLFFRGDFAMRAMLVKTLLRPSPLRRAIAYARRVL